MAPSCDVGVDGIDELAQRPKNSSPDDLSRVFLDQLVAILRFLLMLVFLVRCVMVDELSRVLGGRGID